MRAMLPSPPIDAQPAQPWRYPTALAPMDGLGHPEFRALIADRGSVALVCTEFVSVASSSRSEAALASEVVKAAGVPLSVQLLGEDPRRLAAAAGVMARAGADVVDLNLGCPAKRVVRRGAGAALLRDTGRIEAALAAMRREVPGLLSAKMRAGFDDASRALDNALAIEAAGADFLVIHPRRRVDFYEGVADWRIIAEVKRALRIPVVGNGDCWYAADALRMTRETGCDAVMIGRPAARNPWIFRQIAELRAGVAPFHPSGADVVAYLEEVVRRYRLALTGERYVVGRVKEVLSYLGRAIDDGGVFRHDALRLPALDDILALARTRLAELPPERLDLDARGVLGFERSGAMTSGIPRGGGGT